LGIVGAGGRGGGFKSALEAIDRVRIHAICDIDETALSETGAILRPLEEYSDYGEMLQKSKLDAVLIGTPMPLHFPQSKRALKEGIHVLSEVPAGVSLEECRGLVEACRGSTAKYMMAENYVYLKNNVLMKMLVKEGLLGELYYGEGEYIHELKELNEETPWRRRWQTGVDGVTYPTHSLGPLLEWMEADRVAQISCVGSGRHYRDSQGRRYEQEDTCTALARTEQGRLIRLRLDMLSNRPHAMTNYSLQGTKGCYESARSPLETDKIWLEEICDEKDGWMELQELEGDYLPSFWKNPPEAVQRSGHGGGDYFVLKAFVDSIVDDDPPPIGVHKAMDMSIPGLISQKSINEGGRWLPVPDSREW